MRPDFSRWVGNSRRIAIAFKPVDITGRALVGPNLRGQRPAHVTIRAPQIRAPVITPIATLHFWEMATLGDAIRCLARRGDRLARYGAIPKPTLIAHIMEIKLYSEFANNVFVLSQLKVSAGRN